MSTDEELLKNDDLHLPKQIEDKFKRLIEDKFKRN